MPICPKCNHQWLDKAKSEGGKKSKRRDMGKGSPGQIAAQKGQYRARCIKLFKSTSSQAMLLLSDEKAVMWFDGKKFSKEGE